MRAGICALLALVAVVAHGDERPNVVLVMCDDLGWGDPQAFNADSPIQTPHIDAMAADGLVFHRFYAAAPVCSPTRGSCLTGRHPYRYGVYFANQGHLKQDEITLPELLRKQGYATGHFGKWHLGTLTTEVRDSNRGGPNNKAHYAPPTRHGYDTCFVTEAKVPTFDPLFKPQGAGNTAWDPITADTPTVPYGTRYWDQNGQTVSDNLSGDDSRIIMDRVIPFIESAQAQGKPFFAAVWFHAPHLPVVAGAEHQAAYRGHDVHHRNYYGCVTALDEQIGRLRRALRNLGVERNTMVWFCSDNGPEGRDRSPGSAGPLRGRKRSLYEGGVRVPGILVWPAQVRPGSQTQFAAVTSDYLPTVLDVLELELPDDRPLDGVSLLPLIRGQVAGREAAIGFQSGQQQAWVTQQYKLYSPDSGTTWELYDLEHDPGESTDLAADDPERVRAMRTALASWIESCRASDQGKDY